MVACDIFIIWDNVKTNFAKQIHIAFFTMYIKDSLSILS